MKKVIFGLAVVAAAAFGVYNANKDNAKAQMSDLQTENLEALAGEEYGEGGSSRYSCPWGVAEYYVARDSRFNNSHSSYCDCTPITYYIAHIGCDGQKRCSDNTWFIVISDGK